MTRIRAACRSNRSRAQRAGMRLHNAGTAFIFLAFLAASSAALAVNLDKVLSFNIQARTLDKALLQFGAQAHVQLSLAMDPSVRELRTTKLVGNYTGRQALAKLLKGTGLRFVAHKQTIEILPDVFRQATESDSFPNRKPAQARQASIDPGVAPAGVDDPPTMDTSKSKPTLQSIVVTGSRLPTASNQGLQEVQIYDLSYIDQSGQNSIGDFLSTLPSASIMDDDETNSGQQSTVRLRGLPQGTTLVLVDGRRLESSGFSSGTFFNLDDIPLAAIQRIEVDPNGSSAIYGADAIAGVVNIILKKDFDGVAADVRYGSAKDFGTVRASVAFGRQWSGGGISLIGSFDTDGGLLYSQRRLTASNDYTAFGGPNNNYPDCFPGNVFTTDGSPLPGAPAGSSASFASVTAGATSSGIPALSQFTYGALNECSLYSAESLLPERHRAGILMEAHEKVSKDVEVFSEVMYTHLYTESRGPSEDIFGTSAFQLYTASSSNPYNPFNETVGVALSLPTVPSISTLDTNFFRALVGLKGTLGDRWYWEFSAWQSADWTQSDGINELPNSGAIQDALDSADPATALNPFVDGAVAPQALLQSLFSNEIIKFMGQDRSMEGFIRGPILDLPAGSVDAVLGADHAQSSLYENLADTGGLYPDGTRLSYDRHYTAIFGEVRVPVVRALGHVGDHLLTVTLAGRHDHYSDFGSANTGQLGLELRPTRELLLSGSYAGAFQAPTLSDLYSAQTSIQSYISDPLTGGFEEVSELYGGNSHLRPMTGHSHTFGAAYSSEAVPGLAFSLTQWDVVEDGVIQSVDPQVIVDYAELFPGRVTRNAAGQIATVDDTQVNFGSIDVGGLDYELSYHNRVWRGIWSIEIDATDIYHYRQALVPGSPSIESVSVAEDDSDWAPRWKAIVSTAWQEGALTAHLDGRYTGSYGDYDSARKIGNFWIFDANLRWALGTSLEAGAHWLRKSFVEIGATNLLNRAPQFSNYYYDIVGYDASQMSIVGRALYVNTGVQW